MRVFLTGATGFVGRAATLELTRRGHEVLALTRSPEAAAALLPGVQLLGGALAEPEALLAPVSRFAPEALLHLAWEGLPDYSQAVSERNVDLGLAAFALGQQAGARHLVATGSCWEYAARQGMLAEDAPLKWDQPFPAAKNRLREQGHAQTRMNDRDGETAFTWLRLFFVYGPGQRPASLLPSLVAQARGGLAPSLRNPANRNDFIHVDDVALACALALEKRPAGGVYNVGSGAPARVADVARMVYTALGREELLADLEAQARAQAPTEDFWADTTRLAADTGFAPRISLREGVEDMLRRAGLPPEENAQ
jgi:nucleoside-diphosphate-sugar epimerase